MPGIVGIVTRRPRPWAEGQLRQMVEAQRHEEFYRAGTWIDEKIGIYIGWTALPGSFSDDMPLQNEIGQVSLIFSGEENSSQELAKHLQMRGHSLNCARASYLVHAYEEDASFPSNLNGMFHGVVVDRIRGTALLFNDRYGMHRICYHEAADALYFAAEAKSILAVRPELRVADPQSLGEFVACSCILDDRTLFRNIRVLPGASAWTFRNGTIDKKVRYFHPRQWEEQPELGPEDFYQTLKGVLLHNLPRYFAGPERLGIALTGGLDTRVLLSLHHAAPGTLSSYTFGGMFRDSQDVTIAQRVANQSGIPYQSITVGEEFLAKFPHYAERSIYLTEGGTDVYRASDLYVSEKARQIAPVKIVGTYGSEILKQVAMFKPASTASSVFQPELNSEIKRARMTYDRLCAGHPTTVAAFCQSPWFHQGILSLERSQLTVRSPFLDNDFVSTAYRTPKAQTDSDVRLRLIREGSPALARIRSDRGVGGDGYVAKAVLRNLLEFTFKAEYAYDYGMPQWLARLDHLVSPLRVERLFLGRHKLLHFRIWYRGALAGYVREILLDSKTLSRPYLDRRGIEAVVHGHLKGNRNFTTEIHKLLTLELLQRRFFDAQ